MADTLSETEEGAVAFAFASCHVAGDFNGAQSVAESVREMMTAETLRAHYERMLSYTESQPTMIEVMTVNRDFQAWRSGNGLHGHQRRRLLRPLIFSFAARTPE